MAATLTQIRQFLAREAGRFHASTASGSSSAVAIIDSSWPVNSTVQGSTFYNDYYLFRPSAAAADKVRLVKKYVNTAGELDPDQSWAVAPTNGEAYELHGFFEPGTALPRVINDGLRLCMLPVEFTFQSLNSINTRHDMSTVAPWLTDPNWVRRVGVLGNGANRDQISPYWAKRRGHAAIEGDKLYLHCGSVNPLDTVYVTALKPAYFHVKPAAGGNYGDQTGLSVEGDSVPMDVEWAAYAGLLEAWRRNSELLAQEAAPRLVASIQQAAALFDRWDPKWKDRIPQEFVPVRPWGPRASLRW